jgi:hypothetical protein
MITEEEILMEVLTEEDIAQHYSAMGDSLDLLNKGQPDNMDDSDWEIQKSNNQQHLVIMLKKDFWTDQDMTEFEAAIAL